MPGLDPARLRKLADELEEEERQAQRDLEDASTAKERQEARDELAELRAELAETRKQLEELRATPGGPAPSSPAAGEPGEHDEDGKPKPKTRKGRKHGMVYEGDDGVGYVYQGADEPDLVPVEGEAA